MSYGTKLTILPPMACRGYETFDGMFKGNRMHKHREDGMAGRDHRQFAFKDRQMAHIEELLREMNLESPGWQPSYPVPTRNETCLEDPDPSRLGALGIATVVKGAKKGPRVGWKRRKIEGGHWKWFFEQPALATSGSPENALSTTRLSAYEGRRNQIHYGG